MTNGLYCVKVSETKDYSERGSGLMTVFCGSFYFWYGCHTVGLSPETDV
ncbi:hypothetical protein HMPREF1249_0718 [Jonquetella sp. BV3C21]|nr:hypothetical protein HMPREF1249_0718 [Jonquetella sp. BV3C21]